MKNQDGYWNDLVLAFVLRGWLLGGIMAISAIVLAGCTVSNPMDLFRSSPAVSGSLNRGEGAQTRNRLPQGGCDEKSDSSPLKPLG